MPKGADQSNHQKTINALLELKKHTPEQLVDEPLAFSPTSRPLEMYDVPSSQILHRGQRFFDMIYGKVSKRVMGQMDRSGTEDLGLTARLVYGYLLSNTAVLTPAETSFVLIAGLIPQDVRTRQLSCFIVATPVCIILSRRLVCHCYWVSPRLAQLNCPLQPCQPLGGRGLPTYPTLFNCPTNGPGYRTTR